MKQLRRQGGILITSYGMVSSERINLQETRYDIVVLDEGHKAKNRNTQFRRDVSGIRVKKHRMILTGTPLQNNFAELWSVFDLVQPKIFGSFESFQAIYGNTIERGLLKNCSKSEKREAERLSAELRSIYSDHFLRRTKKEIFTVVSSE